MEALNLKLTTKEDAFLSEHTIQDAKAHEHYIRAWQEMWKRTEQGLDNAVVLAQRGLDAVGENAILYATMGTAYLLAFHYGIRTDPSYREKAKQYALKSLALDSNCAQALFINGLIEFENGNLQEASHVFKKVLHLDPNNTDAMHFLIITYSVSGHADAARPVSERLLMVDPLTAVSHVFPGIIDFYDGQIQASLPSFKRWFELDSESPFVRFWYANVLALNASIEESIKILDSIVQDMQNLIFAKYALFLKSALQRDKEVALRYATDELKAVAATQDYLPINMEWGYALIGEAEEAVNWLRKSLDFGHPYPLISKFEIFHRVLKDRGDFQAYMQEIKKRSEQFII